MKHVQVRGVWRLVVLALLLLLLTAMNLAPLQLANAQDSPLPTPVAEGAATSPLATPLASAADTTAPSSLAGTALTSPGAVAVFVLVALVVVGGMVRYRQRGKR